MNDINRLKIVLVEKKRTSKGLAEKLGKVPQLFQNCVPMLNNPI